MKAFIHIKNNNILRITYGVENSLSDLDEQPDRTVVVDPHLETTAIYEMNGTEVRAVTHAMVMERMNDPNDKVVVARTS